MMTRWNPFEEMNSLFRDMDRLFRHTYSEGPSVPGWGNESTQAIGPSRTSEFSSAFSPAIEVYQKDNQLVLRAELPGVNPEDVEITVANNQLHLRGERKQNKEVQRDHYYFSETSYGRFDRAFTLPQGIKPEDVKASFKNGILEITLPVQERAQTHRVKIAGAPETHKLDTSKQTKPAA